MKARAYTFTINTFDENTEEFLQTFECRYIIYGYEIAPATGRPHFQGYVYFDNPRSFDAVKRLIPGHIEIAKGAPEQNFDYCSKDGLFFERGQRPLSDRAKAANNQERYRLAVIAATEGRFADIPPDLYTRHYSVYQQLYANRAYDLSPRIVPFPWQQEVLDLVTQPPDPRKIVWYVDYEGSKGKSVLTRELVMHCKAVAIPNGTSANMFFMLDRPRIVVLDFARDVEERVNYGAIESIKNGFVHSVKYQPVTKVFPIPHVIVFSNFDPDLTKLSADRWDIRRL